MATQLATRRFSVREYQRMIDAGVLTEDEHVELLEGVVVPMSPTSPKHAAHVARLGELLRLLLGSRAQVREEKAIALEPASQPEPDLAVVRARSDFYAGSHPTAADVLFLIEVADTSLERDRGVKLALYAAAGIPAVWILDLPGDRLWVASEPRGSEYADLMDFRRSDSTRRLPVPGASDLSLAVGDVLGPHLQ
ncbi:MAG: Uma2 family endonuclease [Candidatus Rokubacteria bacterium]|nr:Uma2 family endonuclease [Candidatus Rokubacteria bacterium]